MQLQQYEAAVVAYEKATQIRYNFPEAWNNQAVALYKLNQYERAIGCIDRALYLKPDYQEAKSNL